MTVQFSNLLSFVACNVETYLVAQLGVGVAALAAMAAYWMLTDRHTAAIGAKEKEILED